MRLSKAILIFVLLAVVGLSGVMAAFPKWRPGPVKDAIRQARGYGPADTPEDALDKFRKAVKERDYETAATFVGGDYGEQMAKGSASAEKLALAIDDVLHNMETNSIKSDTSKLALAQLEPFPRDLQVRGQLEKQGEASFATLYEEPLKLEKVSAESWQRDGLMHRSLQPAVVTPLVVRVEIRKDGKGYKLFFPQAWMQDRLRRSVERLNDNYGNYVRGLDQVKYAIKNEATTREDIERHLREVIEAEAK